MCLQNLMNFHHCLFKILKKNQNIKDGWTDERKDGRTDGQRENSIPPTNIVCGGYKHIIITANFLDVQIFRSFMVHDYFNENLDRLPYFQKGTPAFLLSPCILITAVNRVAGKNTRFWLSKFRLIFKYVLSQRMTKPTKWTVRPAKTQVSLGVHPVWSVFAIRMKKPCVLNYPLSAQWRLIRLGACPGWSETSLGTQVILLVLLCCSSFFII